MGFVGDAGTLIASRCSFFALKFASAIGFAAVSADFYVYYLATAPKCTTFSMTWTSTWLALIFCSLVGVGIATGVAANTQWSKVYATSSGALLLACYDGLGGLGGFCVVILTLGSVANNAPCTYATGNTIQVLGRYAKAIPRWVWCVVINFDRARLLPRWTKSPIHIFENFLPIIGTGVFRG